MRYLLTCFCVLLASGWAVAAERPNVLLILVDDLKPNLGAFGDPIAKSPNIDRLAGRGVRFDRAYCNQAVCSPSRNNLLVGSRSTTLGIYDLGTNFRRAVPDAVTLPQYFMQHGYTSAGIGKVFHVGHGNHEDAASWSVPFVPEKVVDYALPESTNGQLTREQAFFSNQKLGDIGSLPRGAVWERADVADNAYADGRIADEAIKRLQNAKQQAEPFFLAVGFVKPHLPFCAPEKYWALYDDVEFAKPKTSDWPAGAPAYAGKGRHMELNQYAPIPQEFPMPDTIRRKLVQGYYASMSYMDAQMGRLLDELDKQGLAENTIVVLWGDHGYHLGDHGAWTKHTNYEQANRIPIIVAGPGVKDGGRASHAIVETVDLYPTIVELAGLEEANVPQKLDGDSLAGVLAGDAAAKTSYAYHAFPRNNLLGRAVRTERYRLVEWKPAGATGDKAEYELYDYEADPDETRNLAGEQLQVVDELKQLLDSEPPALAQQTRRERRAARAAALRDTPATKRRARS